MFNPWIILAAALFFFGSVSGAYVLGRGDGASAVQAKWDTAKAETIRKQSELVLIQQAASDRIAGKLEAERNGYAARVGDLERKVASALGDLRRARLPAAVVRLHNDAVERPGAFAPATGGTAGAAVRPPAATGTESGVTVETYVAVCETNVERHRSCVDQVLGWQEFWGSVQANCAAGKGVK